MIRNFTCKVLFGILFITAFCGWGKVFAQQTPKKDSVTVKAPFKRTQSNNALNRQGIFDLVPFGVTRTVEYDALTNQYILYERIGNLLYRPPVYLTFDQYLYLKQREEKRDYFQKLADNYSYAQTQPGFIPQINVHNQTFERIFGSSIIDIRPQGSAEAILSGQINSNENPLFNTKQRKQYNFNFDQHIQLNLTGNIGDKLKIATNYNTDAQFQFDNQVKLDYVGHPDEIIQEIQAGTVSMPLNTSLITGTQALFGLKTKLKFGKLDVTSIFSQQRSQSKTITITSQGQQGNFSAMASDYEANKHYFLSQFFRNNYNKALANIPIISSNINITKIEVWTTNRTNATTDSRDVVGFLDLGENAPYNTAQIQGGSGFSGLPAGFQGPGFTDQSNNLLANLPANARLTNDPSNSLIGYFATHGGTDNYAKLTYARKLTSKEFTLHPQLGYISLNYPLNNDEVLAVAYQYTYNGKQYQVGEFSSDIAVSPAAPKLLYLKLLKNTLLKTNLPTWKLMMKNIYSLNAFQVSPTNFKLTVARLDDKTGVDKPIMQEGQNTSNKLWLKLTGLDNLNQQGEKQPDGYFDFLEGITIDSQNGRISFPVLEPFGSDLAKQFNPGETDLINRYVYQQLYDSTKTVAQQFFPKLNRYAIRGTYTSAGGGGSYQLNAINIPQGSVTVTAGATKMIEGTDYTIDYNVGRLNVINTAILSSGQPIEVHLENNELFGVQQKSLYGTRFDYKYSPNLALGATIMHLTEQPISQNEIIGQESISNTIWGFDANYASNSRFLTRLVDKIPFIHTKAPSSVNLSGEFAQLLPGSPSVLNYAGSKNGTSYLDDFENSQSVIDVKSANAWQISGTPQMFPEANLYNNLSYGFNRARLAFYNIDPIFYTNTSSTGVTRAQLSNHYTRQVLQTEVFPYKQSVTGQPLSLSTLDLAFYPTVRGPYNYTTTGINPDGSLQNPTTRWGGMYRGISTNDFQAQNVTYIEFWVMNPFIYKPNSAGGDLYFNLGSISEDVLKDGRKSLENGLPVNGDLSTVDTTAWGRVPKAQPVVNAFDSNPASRALQDVGLDGLGDADEQAKFAPAVQKMKSVVNAQAANTFANDPSSDDYQYYLGPEQDAARASILQRYSKYNGNEGNSKTAEQSQALLGLQTSANTSLPDGEDIDRDNNMSQDDQYFQYKVSMRPQDLVVGQNFVNDKVTSQVKLADGTNQSVTWYQFRIPIMAYQSAVGGIQDFKAIRYMRMFMTNFADTAVLRFAAMELVKGDWRAYNTENNPLNVIADPALTNPPLDNSVLNVETVNIEENGNRVPIPYVVPPGIQRQRDYNNLQTNTQLNEQSLSLNITNLSDGYSKAAFKTFYNDLRKYKHLQMFIHAEANNQSPIKDNDVSAFIRLGADYQDNYYEYEIPLAITPSGTTNASSIWPDANALDIELTVLTDAKIARNNAKFNGLPWPINKPFTFTSGRNKITIKGVPDLSRLRTIMLGVRNPYRNNSPNGVDDGLAKSAIIWFDELRLTDFDNKGGWAAIGRADFKLADFANVTVSGNKSTAGFGALDSRLQDRQLTDNQGYDLSANMDLGRFLPAKSGVKIPAYVNVSNQVNTPQYDPAQPDILLKQTLAGAKSTQQRDSIKHAAEDYTMRKSVNFTNVHKERAPDKKTAHVYDVENLNASYAYTEYTHHDFITESDVEKTYRVALAYNYTNQPKYVSPFEKIIKNNMLALIRDINFSIAPTRLNFSINFDRFYSENSLRNNDPSNPVFIPTTYNKNFNITRVYGIGWNLTKSLTMDIDATNLSVVDEPYGRLDGLKIDTLWRNIRRLGRTTNYNHTFNINYTVPLNKIPYMDWTALMAHYSTNFTWQAAPEFAIGNPQFNVGNSIQNARKIQLDPALNLVTLYNKISFLKQSADDKRGTFNKIVVGILTSVKSVNASYTRTDGTFLPGYLPQSNLFGEDLSYDAPGIGFLLGSQADIRGRAIANNWISRDTLQNQLYVQSVSEDLHLRASVEPSSDLRIQLTAFKTQDHTYQTNFKYLSATNSFQNLAPNTSGNYSISYFSLATAFSKEAGVNNTSAPFQKFLDNRSEISKRLGRTNPNSAGVTSGFADGYGPNSQNVLVPAFLAAYTGKDASGANLSQFPSFPVPNWLITYSGLSRIPLFQDWFDSFDIRNGYQSTYSVNGYNTLLQYRETNGASSARDVNNDFLPLYQFSQITILEQFVPLLGIDVRFKNNVTANFEYRQSRALSLSLLNSQLTQLSEHVVTFGFGYKTRNFRFPFGLFDNLILKNDLNFKLDFALRDNKTLIYQADVTAAQISSGAQNITYRPSIDYTISQRFILNLFYDSNLTKPFTSQAFNTSFTNFGVNLKLLLQ
ncbi:MAG: cell surface protein SprA [Bacteroidota bacterium]